MQYERMKYGHDQRAWVKMVDEKLPGMIEETIKSQQAAADNYEVTQHYRSPVFFSLRQEASDKAVKGLLRIIFFQGMRRANLPQETGFDRFEARAKAQQENGS